MKRIKQISAWILTLAILLTLTVPTFAASSVQSEVQSSAAFMLSSVKSPEVGSIGGEWAVLGLARSGYSVPTSYYDEYYTRVEKYVKNCDGVLHDRKYTEYSRVILALTAIGRDPSNVAGYNLLTPLGDFDKTIWQGLNGPIWMQYAKWIGNVMQGDFGISLKYKRPVLDVVSPLIGNTLMLGGIAYALVFMLAIALALF